MKGKKKEMTDLRGQHDAIRAQMRFLTEALRKLAEKTTAKLQTTASPNELLRNYCDSLNDLRDGVIAHIELDENIFGALSSELSDESLAVEHTSIKQQIDRTIDLVDDALTSKMRGEKLDKRISEIILTIENIRKLIESHTAKEDSLLKLS